MIDLGLQPLSETTYLPRLRDGYRWKVWLNSSGTIHLKVLKKNLNGVTLATFDVAEIDPNDYWGVDEDEFIIVLTKELYNKAMETMEWHQWSPKAHHRWERIASRLYPPVDSPSPDSPGLTAP